MLKYHLSYLRQSFRRAKTYRTWRNLNPHNYTSTRGGFDFNKVKVGRHTYGELNVTDWSDRDTKLLIGSYCSIAPDVKFLLGGEHQVSSISTFPFKVKRFGDAREAGSKGDIVVCDDVWIGTGAIICSGVKLGQGAIVAAGAVVTKSIEPYAVVGGNPAKLIKYRFDKPLRDRLCSIDVAALFDKFAKEDADLLYEDLNEENLTAILEKYNVK